MRLLPCSRVLTFCCATLLETGACNAMLPPAVTTNVSGLEQHGAYLFGFGNDVKQGNDLKQRQAAFLGRLRAADPQHQTIERAVFNQQNELGLILSRSVELDKIPALMRSVLTQMARAFPGQDLTVLAYAPSNPPRKIGTARLNARTRDMTYTPER
jgi:hypothetical protein